MNKTWTVTVCIRGSEICLSLKLSLQFRFCTRNDEQTELKQMLGVYN